MTTTEQIVTNRQDPAIEAYRLGLLEDTQKFISDQIGTGVTPPDYQVAGLSPSEQAAVMASQEGVGAYQPYLNRGMGSLQAAENMTLDAANPMQTGINSLAGSDALYDPTSYTNYMNPYEDSAVASALSDIQRSGDIAQQGVRANAIQAGAFGGSRGAIAEQELQRNTMDQQARTAAQMRAAGYGQAQQLGQGAFDSAMNRQQSMANSYGQLGQGIGQLGNQLGQIGIQQAGIGEMRSGLGSSDIQNLMATGASERGVQQAGLDATRLSNLQRYTQPYQQYGFLSDIYSGTPSGSSTLTASSMPQVSPFQSALGLGIAGLSAASGASKAGLF
tara:strand:- start:1741 stop:2736 length:996 start_codon:yes stop_codon:yes gene_type:complete